jgi:hypothetical protein
MKRPRSGKDWPLLRGHIKTRLVDEHSRTDAYLALAYELASCQSVQFPIEKSTELIGRSFVAMFRQTHEGSDCYVGRLHDIPTRRTASRIS